MADNFKRDVLPILDGRYQGLITYDAKDPSSSFLPRDFPARRGSKTGRGPAGWSGLYAKERTR